jgi:hypothetical protein
MVPEPDHVHGGAWCGDSDRAGWCDDEPDFGGDPDVDRAIQDAAGNTVTLVADSTATVAFWLRRQLGCGHGQLVWATTPRSTGWRPKTVTGVLVGSVTIRATSGTCQWCGEPITFTVVHGAAIRSRWMVRRRT